MKLIVHVKTNKPESKIIKQTENELWIELHAKPKEGEANLELLKFLKKKFKSSPRIISGKTSKVKMIEL